jgi:hypothetical protein
VTPEAVIRLQKLRKQLARIAKDGSRGRSARRPQYAHGQLLTSHDCALEQRCSESGSNVAACACARGWT